jgi:alpha-beta hydrolase superfamily lysophospholipase
MGGLVVAGYLLDETARPLPDLAILSAPALSDTLPAWKRRVADVLSGVVPRLALRNGFPDGGLSRDPTIQARYEADPLVVPRSTTRFAAEAFREQARIATALQQGRDLPVPTFVIHGGADPIVPLASSEALVGRGDVTRRVFPGLRHECHNEPEWHEVLDAMLAWLHGRLGSVSQAAPDTPGGASAAAV